MPSLSDAKSLARHLLTTAFHYLLPGRAHRRALRRLAYPEAELAILPALVDPARESIDAGANFGLYAAALAPISRHVHAIEAHPRMQRVLSGIRARNLTIHRRAVSDRSDAIVQLAVQRQGSQELDGLSRLSDGAVVGTHKLYPVRSVALDDFAGRSIGFVKIDIEGHEMAALQGARALIDRQHPVFLVETEMRHRPAAPFDVFAFFAERHYRGFYLQGGRLHPVGAFAPAMQDDAVLASDPSSVGRSYINNFIFLPPDHDDRSLGALMADGRDGSA